MSQRRIPGVQTPGIFLGIGKALPLTDFFKKKAGTNARPPACGGRAKAVRTGTN
jgi:hypothetical protein